MDDDDELEHASVWHRRVRKSEDAEEHCLEHSAIDPACIDHYARTVSEWTKANTVSFGLPDTIRRFRDCLGR